MSNLPRKYIVDTQNCLRYLMPFERQGTLDGACVPYCTIMTLQYLFEEEEYEMLSSSVAEFLKSIEGEPFMPGGTGYRRLKRSLEDCFADVNIRRTIKKDISAAVAFVKEAVQHDYPVLLAYTPNAAEMGHCTVAIGFDESSKAIYLLDPSRDCSLGTLFNDYLWKPPRGKYIVNSEDMRLGIDWCALIRPR